MATEENIKIKIEFDVEDDSGKIGKKGRAPSGNVIKREREQEDINETVGFYKAGNVEQISKFSSSQFGNIKSFASNPFAFMGAMFLKKLGKGFGIAFLLALAAAVVQFVIDLMFAPGRPLDNRIKIKLDEHFFGMTERMALSQLRQGFKTVIVSTMPGLRGMETRGQISGNLYHQAIFPAGGVDPRLVAPNVRTFDTRLSSGRRSFRR